MDTFSLKLALPWLQFPSTVKCLSDVQKGRQTQPERWKTFYIKLLYQIVSSSSMMITCLHVSHASFPPVAERELTCE